MINVNTVFKFIIVYRFVTTALYVLKLFYNKYVECNTLYKIFSSTSFDCIVLSLPVSNNDSVIEEETLYKMGEILLNLVRQLTQKKLNVFIILTAEAYCDNSVLHVVFTVDLS